MSFRNAGAVVTKPQQDEEGVPKQEIQHQVAFGSTWAPMNKHPKQQQHGIQVQRPKTLDIA